ncbi:SHOCT domain-containing protein [Herbiconiux sp. VKM Ac-2851]|uniref:SHOCT domain-containing protein n=1 Tax=Herbiconiux sp. VKM Ac-2851 TaxID=2739025 RepID=UPI0015643DAD|nr:SHOCT domain-containing protein [Herbiconiux sp. VKM Ac-2851]NQX36928.1 SHOCT domain-containing protein [Herbiconiux sp. VKM Ac-2851]
MLGRRIGRGGLLGAAARTAVIAGTATAVSGGMRSRGAARDQQAAEAAAYEQQQQQAQIDFAAQQAAAQQAAQQQAATQQAAQQQAPAPTAAPGPGGDLMAQLQQLAQLHAQGILSDDEFTAAKSKLLA